MLPSLAASKAVSVASAKAADWHAVRAGFDLDSRVTHLNTAGLGAISRRVRERRARAELDIARDPALGQTGAAALDDARSRVAALINGNADDIAITRSTTEGLNLFAFGLDFRAGDEVILGSEEHNAALAPYRALERRIGIKLVRVELPAVESLDSGRILDAYRKAITPRSRVIVASHVTYRSGTVLPIRELAALAHQHGLLISIDGAQSFGLLPLDIRALDLDHYAAPGQKWLLAGTGTGLVWIRRELQSRVHPLSGDYDPQSQLPAEHTARRYEKTGQRNVADLHGLGEALDLHASIGTTRIAGRVRELTTRLRTGVDELDVARIHTPASAELSAGIVSFTLRSLPVQAVFDALRARQIIVRTVPLGAETGIRVSTHVYNTEDDVDRLLALLRDFAAKPALLTSSSLPG